MISDQKDRSTNGGIHVRRSTSTAAKDARQMRVRHVQKLAKTAKVKAKGKRNGIAKEQQSKEKEQHRACTSRKEKRKGM